MLTSSPEPAGGAGMVLLLELGAQERTGAHEALGAGEGAETPLTGLCLPEKHHRFDPAKSSTFRDLGKPLSIQYGTGSMEGVLGTDTVIVSGPPRPAPPGALGGRTGRDSEGAGALSGSEEGGRVPRRLCRDGGGLTGCWGVSPYSAQGHE